MVEVANGSSVSLTANQTIPFTTVNFDTNNRAYFNQSTNAIVITKVGKYEINGSFVVTPTGAGVMKISAYANGNPIPFDFSQNTTVASDVLTFNLPQKVINVIRSQSNNNVSITFVVDSDCTMTNAVASVNYVE